MFNVLICGVVKNAGDHLERNIQSAIELGERCGNSKIVIYENNSTDATKTILQAYQAQLIVLSEDISAETLKRDSKIWAYTKVTGSDHPCRMEQIANARNKLVDELQKETYNAYQYVVMIDFDSKQFLVDGILDSLRLVAENPKRVLYANSLNYYDYYALRSTHADYSLFGPELMGEHFWQLMSAQPLKLEPSAPLFPVYSAFNGIGVYAKDVFTGHFYDSLPTPAVRETYKAIAQAHPDAYAKYKSILQSTCPKFPGGERDELFYWKNNSGYDKPVICEHVAFNFALINEGGYEICINPRMLYWW
jgi:hypothetical protein